MVRVTNVGGSAENVRALVKAAALVFGEMAGDEIEELVKLFSSAMARKAAVKYLRKTHKCSA